MDAATGFVARLNSIVEGFILGPIRVIDIPNSTSAEEAASFLNALYAEGFYLHSVVPYGDRMRAIFKILKSETARRNPKQRGNTDGREADALTIIRDHPRDSIRVLLARLGRAGIKRGKNWVSEKRLSLRSTQTGVIADCPHSP